MGKTHHYALQVQWTGNTGSGTSNYRDYERDHEIIIPGKPILYSSSDPSFRGNPNRYNPEELLVASLSSCHMLWFLHLCAEAGVIVTDYGDNPVGTMAQTSDGGGQFTEVTLRPDVTVSEEAMSAQLPALHHRANQLCFIARSVNFPVRHEGRYRIA